jgi:hypothetical protein
MMVVLGDNEMQRPLQTCSQDEFEGTLLPTAVQSFDCGD